MTERVARLRQESLDRKPTLSTERAELMTAFYREAPSASMPMGVSAPARRSCFRRSVSPGAARGCRRA